MYKLAGLTTNAPQKRSAYDTWADTDPSIRKDLSAEEKDFAKEHGIKTGRAAMRQNIMKRMFSELPLAEQKQWEETAEANGIQKKKDHKEGLKASGSKEPEDQQQ